MFNFTWSNKMRYILGSALSLSGTIGYHYFHKINPADCAEPKIEQDLIDPRNNLTQLTKAIVESRKLILRLKEEVGTPGIVVGVSINGYKVWEEGFGYADLENGVICKGDTVMRLGSISKSLTVAAVAKLWEENKLDLNKSIYEYVPEFPVKLYEGERVEITVRQLLSHLSGIRHYSKILDDKNSSDGVLEEFYSNKNCKNVQEALKIFKDDPLLVKPGTKYVYSTHGFTLLSNVIEKVSGEDFTVHMNKMFDLFGMENTRTDVNDVLVYNRARYYQRSKSGLLTNTPFVDNSCKWAGGGFLSTVGDLLNFAHVLLYSVQPFNGLTGFLKPDTVEMLWKPVKLTANKNDGSFYGMGWVVVVPKEEKAYGKCLEKNTYVYHSGAAVGASSLLLILPSFKEGVLKPGFPVPGVSVAILTNLGDVRLSKVALEIAKIFEKAQIQ